MPAADRPRWIVVSALGVVQILTWGGTFYLVAVISGPVAADTGWGQGAVAGALSAGLLVAGLASPAVGRAIARHGGRPVLATGCALIAAGLVLLAAAPTLTVWWAGWLVIGLGMAAGLYDPAFAALGRLYGADARGAITALTLWGGFASTVGWPMSALALEALGWRGTVLAWAALNLLVAAPLTLLAVPREPAVPRPAAEPATADAGPADTTPETAARTRAERAVLRLFAAMLVLNGLMVVNVSAFLFIFLAAQGVPLSTAVALGALIGPAQVAARLLEAAGRGRHHPLWTLTASSLAICAGLALLAADAGLAGAALVLYGGGNGLFSIARGALPLAVFGGARMPAVMGRLARAGLIAQAAAPVLGAWATGLIGAPGTLVALAVLSAANLVVLALLWRATPRG